MSRRQRDLRVTAVAVDGIEYLSDRFYLLRATGDEAPSTNSHRCCCGASEAPPVLDRQRLVESLDLKAAIIATYTVNVRWAQKALPSLFGPIAVPTLVLHGNKGLERFLENYEDKENDINASQSSRDDDSHLDSPYKKRKLTQRKKPIPSEADIICLDGSFDDGEEGNLESDEKEKVAVKLEDEAPPEEGWLRTDATPSGEADDDVVEPYDLPVYCHLTQVLPTWLPLTAPVQSSWDTKSSGDDKEAIDDDSAVIVLDSDDERDYKEPVRLDPEILEHRVRKLGVHHPKYMLLFEKSGSIVVVVSTANLTKQTSVDGVWLQRFEPTERIERSSTLPTFRRDDGSDFGMVLTNFLECQSNAAAVGSMLPEDFLYRYLGIDGLEEFVRRYRFYDSQVHLIAHVPGTHRGRFTATHISRRSQTFLYGPQRIADILDRLGGRQREGTAKKKKSVPWFPDRFNSNHDQLILQPTSFGGYWTRETMSYLIRELYGQDDRGRSLNGGSDDKLMNKVSIVWPSMAFMRTACAKRVCKHPPRASISPSVPSKPGSEHERAFGSFVFLSSTSFNTIDLACLSRLAQYDISVPSQFPSLRPPHFKSYARVLRGDVDRRLGHFGAADEHFSWFLLTSACLSQGAQGVACGPPDGDEMDYKNFELGVMFCSRYQGDGLRDRLYCWKPKKCACRGTTTTSRLIHLPVPYNLRPIPYQTEKEETMMEATPYFHDIPKGTACVGQMKLTPLGSKLATEVSNGSR